MLNAYVTYINYDQVPLSSHYQSKIYIIVFKINSPVKFTILLHSFSERKLQAVQRGYLHRS